MDQIPSDLRALHSHPLQKLFHHLSMGGDSSDCIFQCPASYPYHGPPLRHLTEKLLERPQDDHAALQLQAACEAQADLQAQLGVMRGEYREMCLKLEGFESVALSKTTEAEHAARATARDLELKLGKAAAAMAIAKEGEKVAKAREREAWAREQESRSHVAILTTLAEKEREKNAELLQREHSTFSRLRELEARLQHANEYVKQLEERLRFVPSQTLGEHDEGRAARAHEEVATEELAVLQARVAKDIAQYPAAATAGSQESVVGRDDILTPWDTDAELIEEPVQLKARLIDRNCI